MSHLEQNTSLLTPNDILKVQTALHLVSSVSIVPCVFVILAVYYFDRLRNTVNYMYVNLAISQILVSLACAFGDLFQDNDALCQSQAFILEFGLISTLTWTLLIPLHCYLVVSNSRIVAYLNDGLIYCYYLIGWIIPVLFSVSMVILNAQMHFITASIPVFVCWIRRKFIVKRFGLFYVPLWLTNILVVLLHILIIRTVMKKLRKLDKKDVLDFSYRQMVLKTLSTTFAILLIWVPLTVVEILAFDQAKEHSSAKLPFFIWVLTGMTLPLNSVAASAIFLYFAFA